MNLFNNIGGWRLERSPLAPSVPLEGSDTVQGLRTLERLRAAGLQDGEGGGQPPGRRGPAPQPSRRRRYQRFKGPFLEQLSSDDFKRDPRPWRQFAGAPPVGFALGGYDVPATLDILCERMEENGSFYVTNYMRLAVVCVLLTLYLRPAALFGAAALAISIGYNMARAIETQQIRQQQQQQQRHGGGAAAAGAAALPPQTTQIGALLAIVAWLMVAYTRCMPVIFLGMALAAVVIGTHAATRHAPSEARYRGRDPLGYPFKVVFGLQMAPAGRSPRLVFRQAGQAGRELAADKARAGVKWARYWGLTAWDAVRRTVQRRGQTGW